ncbi:TRAP transporter small permease [Tropicimonas sp. IMCC6043]|uniref:TRAP transporter small permease n=1 Tax=Tropicimonas sp. IMCC6043 TaxID=2510645 RepID=UPI0013EBCF4B|nr:TRAP transporter small permease [Tropicimonas sp. IMCC6043]
MTRIDNLLGWIAAIYTRIAQAILVALVLGVLTQVVYRYVFGRSIIGLEELTKLGLIWLTFLTAAVLHRRRRHISVSALYDVMPASSQRLAEILTSLATIVLALFLSYQMNAVWGFMMLKSPVYHIPDTWFRSAPLAAFIPILLQECVNLAREVRARG